MISNLVRKSVKPTDDFVIYAYAYNGIFENMLGVIPNITIYADPRKSHNKWRPYFSNDAKNVKPLTLDRLPFNDINFDAVFCNSRIHQQEAARNAAMYLNVPLVIVDHVGPDKKHSKLDIEVIKETYHGNHYVATNIPATRWNNAECIPYYVDIPVNTDDYVNDYIFCGDFQGSDFMTIREIADDLEGRYRVIGNENYGMLYEEMEEAFLQSKVYIHLPTNNGLSWELLLAMACGCAVVSSKTDATESVIQDDVNGILVSNIDEVGPMARSLAKNQEKIEKFASFNRNMLETSFSKEIFINNWTKQINTIKRTLFVP